MYSPGCWSPCVSWKLTGRSLADCFSDSLVNNWSSDWKASHKMPKNICLSKLSRAINPVVVDRAKEHLLGLGLHGTPAGNTWGLSYCRITLSPFHALSWTMTDILKSYSWGAGHGQPVWLVTKIQKVIEIGITKCKCLGKYKDQIIVLLSPEY